MGEHIHIGGEKETQRLAEKLGVRDTYILDICSALGGPSRYLAKTFNATVLGVDITKTMLDKATARTLKEGLQNKVEFRRGNALDLPVSSNSMDIVWGQDAWCYVTDKARLIQEAVRVCKPGGKIGFTDWILGSTPLSQEEADFLYEFMIFPNLETLDGYKLLLEDNKCQILEIENLQEDFATHMKYYYDKIQEMRDSIIQEFGSDLYQIAEAGVKAWKAASEQGKVTRGLWIAEKI
ncbi:ubiquinone biosynthesis protein UbiE [Candidatus Heimdallarchaeota archaeon B3_Heim]|nr:MAG: ubiquinone biosynthesis protein UbiE [Candidatus Heimdallarchaeota archaeon B3_Heim]